MITRNADEKLIEDWDAHIAVPPPRRKGTIRASYDPDARVIERAYCPDCAHEMTGTTNGWCCPGCGFVTDVPVGVETFAAQEGM